MLNDRSGSGSYLEQQPAPVLLDFGSARRVVADATQHLTTLLKSGYSPVEQYDNDGAMLQGPWTDIYALCAVLYTAAIGRVPNAAIARVVRDDLVPARVAGKGRYSPVFLAAIDAGLSVRPEKRPQTMALLMKEFSRTEAPPEPAVTAPDAPRKAAPRTANRAMPIVAAAAPARKRLWRWGLGLGALLVLALVAYAVAARR